MENKTTIVIKKSTRKKLAKLGTYDDTMDDIINRLIERGETRKDERKIL